MSEPHHPKDQPHQIVINERRSGRGMIAVLALIVVVVLGIYYALHQTDLEDRREAGVTVAAKANPSPDTDTPAR